MRTFRLVAALLMVALCFNFVSCSKDEEGSNPDKQTKRLVSVSYTNEDGDKDNLQIEYENGKVSKTTTTYYDDGLNTDIYTYSYSGNTVTEVHKGGRTTNYKLNDNGYITEGLSTDGSDIWEFGYSGNFLTSVVLTYSVTGRKDIDEKFTYNNEGLLTSDSDGFDYIEYTDIPNIGNLFLTYSDEYPLTGISIQAFYAGILGNAAKRLPKEARSGDYRETYSYELDKDGYVKNCTITQKDYDGGKTYTYIWKGTYTYEPCE